MEIIVDFFSNPVYIFGVVGVLLLICILLIFKIRKSSKKSVPVSVSDNNNVQSIGNSPTDGVVANQTGSVDATAVQNTVSTIGEVVAIPATAAPVVSTIASETSLLNQQAGSFEVSSVQNTVSTLNEVATMPATAAPVVNTIASETSGIVQSSSDVQTGGLYQSTLSSEAFANIPVSVVPASSVVPNNESLNQGMPNMQANVSQQSVSTAVQNTNVDVNVGVTQGNK